MHGHSLLQYYVQAVQTNLSPILHYALVVVVFFPFRVSTYSKGMGKEDGDIGKNERTSLKRARTVGTSGN